MQKERIEQLLHLISRDEASRSEKEELYALYADPSNAALVHELIEALWEANAFKDFLSQTESQQLYQSIQKHLSKERRSVTLVRMKRWLVAASLVGLLFLGWWLFSKHPDAQTTIAGTEPADIAAPLVSKASLTSPDGKTIDISNRSAIRADELMGAAKKGWQTLSNPRGSKPVSLLLSDGTKLWLSAESSVKYPLLFSGTERTVQARGEIYFEVAHKTGQPFIVETATVDITVLGTHFNINTFSEKTRVTLLEGSVHVRTQRDSETIQPGQSAIVGKEILVERPDTTSIMAWKNDLFSFKEAPLQDILQEVGRWYDVEIDYQTSIPKITLSGSMNRSTNASKVLEKLELSSGLRFKIEGRRIIVKQ